MIFLNLIFNLPRNLKRSIVLFFDTIFIFISFWGAWVVRLDSSSVFFEPEKWTLFFLILPITIVTLIKLGLYRAVLRYLGPKATVSILTGICISTLTLVLVSYFLQLTLPRAIPLLYGTFLIIFIGGSRLSIRILNMPSSKRDKRRVVIYGSGPAGRQLAQALMHGKDFDPIAFIDDDKNLHKTYILGRPVYSFAQFESFSGEVSIDQVLLAMPNINRRERSIVLAKLEPLALEVKSIPSMTDLVNGDARIDELREVAIDELLGREPVSPNQDLMSKNITSKVVIVTGAGGSIGSELCRQIVCQKPKVLILFEISEFALYKVDAELNKLIEKNGLSIIIKPILGSVQNKSVIKSVLRTFNVETVYHAAAYKHVPLVEFNIVEGVKNNTFGTNNVASAAAEVGVDTFVLISTDKAVRSTNIMGSTKRLAELCLQALSKDNNKTTFCMVRFGNVLGSSGSVVPLFREQIRKGGPVTITHKDITRYFMTIPEASQLVIQAGAMAKGGDVFVLDMGQSVKIADLAIKMVHLMGLEIKNDDNPGGDIELQYSGLRPGEKLYEELLIGDNIIATAHQRIMSAQESSLDIEEMNQVLQALKLACDNHDIKKIQKIIIDAPTGYSPNSELCDLLWSEYRSITNLPLH